MARMSAYNLFFFFLSSKYSITTHTHAKLVKADGIDEFCSGRINLSQSEHTPTQYGKLLNVFRSSEWFTIHSANLRTKYKISRPFYLYQFRWYSYIGRVIPKPILQFYQNLREKKFPVGREGKREREKMRKQMRWSDKSDDIRTTAGVYTVVCWYGIKCRSPDQKWKFDDAHEFYMISPVGLKSLPT